MVRYVFGLQVLSLLLAGGLTADAYEFGDWVKGSPKVVDGATLSINGQQISLHGILPINPRRICTSGGRRIPCKGLALAALGDMVQNAVVLCEIVAEDPRGRLTGR